MNNQLKTTVFSNLKSEEVDQITTQLNQLLADYHIHYQKLRNFHWNVYGEHFFELHKQFESLYNSAKVAIDEIAERILTLQKRPVSNYSDYLYMSALTEEKETLRPRDMVEATLKDFDLMINRMNELISTAGEFDDNATADLITGFQKDIQKTHWMFRAFLRESILST